MSTQLSSPVGGPAIQEGPGLLRSPLGSCKKGTMPSDYEIAHLLLDFLYLECDCRKDRQRSVLASCLSFNWELLPNLPHAWWILIYGHYWYSIPSFHEESDLNDVLRQMGWCRFFATGSNSRSALRKWCPGWSTLHAWLSKPIRDFSFHLVQLHFIFYACRISFNLSVLSVGRRSSIACMYSSIPSIGMQVDGSSVFRGATGKCKLLHTCRAFWRRCLHSEEPGGPMIIK